jgi:hypothetical protein
MSHRATSTDGARGGRVLNREQFVVYARDQIATAMILLAAHGHAGRACGCGRPWPCPQQRSLTATAEHFRGRLALLDPTLVLPMLTPPTTPDAGRRPLQRLRTLLRLIVGR